MTKEKETNEMLRIAKPDFWDDMSRKQQNVYMAIQRNNLAKRISREHQDKIKRLKEVML